MIRCWQPPLLPLAASAIFFRWAITHYCRHTPRRFRHDCHCHCAAFDAAFIRHYAFAIVFSHCLRHADYAAADLLLLILLTLLIRHYADTACSRHADADITPPLILPAIIVFDIDIDWYFRHWYYAIAAISLLPLLPLYMKIHYWYCCWCLMPWYAMPWYWYYCHYCHTLILRCHWYCHYYAIIISILPYITPPCHYAIRLLRHFRRRHYWCYSHFSHYADYWWLLLPLLILADIDTPYASD